MLIVLDRHILNIHLCTNYLYHIFVSNDPYNNDMSLNQWTETKPKAINRLNWIIYETEFCKKIKRKICLVKSRNIFFIHWIMSFRLPSKSHSDHFSNVNFNSANHIMSIFTTLSNVTCVIINACEKIISKYI